MPVFSKINEFYALSSVPLVDLQKLARDPQFTLTTYLHQQPFAPLYTKQMLKKDGVERVLLNSDEVPKIYEYTEGDQLGGASVVPAPNFYDHYGAGSPYGIYNWELEFHLPMLVANRLSQTQRYEEAQRWYHFVFNPAQVQNGNAWVFKPFKDELFNTIEDLLSDADHKDFKSWYENPFLPHAVASFRIEAYMMYTLMKYLDNLIEWGDNLFRRDTIESINEATQYYVLASDILGPKPKSVPKQINPSPLTYAQIKAQRTGGGNTEGLNNPRVDIALNAPYATDRPASEISGTSTLYGIVQNVGYFGVPANKKLLEYWDKVADRLFKIRNCQNIDGVVRELPLFEPPIDPALLIRAAQAGLDLSAVINDLYAPMPHYRFQILLQKANEYCNEVKAFGNALLSALEKKDSEELAIIRARHEQQLLNLTRFIKVNQLKEAEQALEGLRINHQAAEFRYKHYEKMLGNKDKAVPAFKKEEVIDITDFEPSGFKGVNIVDNGGVKIIAEEGDELAQGRDMISKNEVASVFETIAGFSNILPNISVGSGVSVSFGGSNLGAAFSAIASIYRFESNKNSIQASNLAKTGSWILRQDEWMQQSRAAALEINQLKRQMLAAEIRIAIAQKEIENHEQQMLNAKEVLDFIAGDESVVKFTSNATLYNWMIGQLMMLYRQSYKMAHDLAKQAERCYRYELGVSDSNFIQFNYWDNDKKGLLSGDRLSNALRQMEKAYMDQNKRDFEITKHISLNQLDPNALLDLREKGKCDFFIPEELFDLDFPGHYMRRIKTVSITIPCIAGPYTTINATLRLKTNRTRVKSLLPNGSYPRTNSEDDRFRDQLTGIQSIATSSAQNDSGLFELNFRDERYLPFEGAGVISDWALEMMHDEKDPEGAKLLRQFDYNTISDVIVHLRYTAREDGALKTAATNHLKTLTDKLGEVPLARLFSLRSDFPNEWHRWIKGTEDKLEITLETHHFPYLAQSRLQYGPVALFPDPKPVTAPVGEIVDGKLSITGLAKNGLDCYAVVNYSLSPTPSNGGGTNTGAGNTGAGNPGGTIASGSATSGTVELTAVLQVRATEIVKNTAGSGNRAKLALPALANTADSLLFVTPKLDQAMNRANFVSWINNAWWVNTPDQVTALSLHVAVARSGANAFQHTATTASLYKPEAYTIKEKYASELDHPALNGNPDAIIFATQLRGANGATETDKDRYLAVWYNPARRKWAIVFPSRYDIPAGTVFNVLIGTGPNALRHRVTPDSIHRNQINLSLLPPAVTAGKVLMVTEYWPYLELVSESRNVLNEVNQMPFNIEWYAEYRSWGIMLLVNGPIKPGMEFNVLVV